MDSVRPGVEVHWLVEVVSGGLTGGGFGLRVAEAVGEAGRGEQWARTRQETIERVCPEQ